MGCGWEGLTEESEGEGAMWGETDGQRWKRAQVGTDSKRPQAGLRGHTGGISEERKEGFGGETGP